MEEEGEDQENEKERDSRIESEQPHHERMKIRWSEMCVARQT